MKKILTVDDSASMRAMVAFTLKAQGFVRGSGPLGLKDLPIIELLHVFELNFQKKIRNIKRL